MQLGRRLKIYLHYASGEVDRSGPPSSTSNRAYSVDFLYRNRKIRKGREVGDLWKIVSIQIIIWMIKPRQICHQQRTDLQRHDRPAPERTNSWPITILMTGGPAAFTAYCSPVGVIALIDNQIVGCGRKRSDMIKTVECVLCTRTVRVGIGLPLPHGPAFRNAKNCRRLSAANCNDAPVQFLH